MNDREKTQMYCKIILLTKTNIAESNKITRKVLIGNPTDLVFTI